MPSAHDLYVGSRCLALFEAQSRVWAQAVSGIDEALGALADRLKAQERKLRLRVWLSGGLCRPFLMPAVEGVKGSAELQRVAEEVARRTPVGIAAYKPANSHPEKESYIFDYAGMLGLPLVPVHEFPADAPAAFFSVHALKDPDFAAKLKRSSVSERK